MLGFNLLVSLHRSADNANQIEFALLPYERGTNQRGTRQSIRSFSVFHWLLFDITILHPFGKTYTYDELQAMHPVDPEDQMRDMLFKALRDHKKGDK